MCLEAADSLQLLFMADMHCAVARTSCTTEHG